MVNTSPPLSPLTSSHLALTELSHRNANISHIASGYLYASPSLGLVRVDEAYDGALGSSLFNFTDVKDEGVLNVLWTLSPAITSKPEVFRGYVQPAFPLLTADVLGEGSAVYAGGEVDEDGFALEKVRI
jgi:hypothetical protein